MRETVLRALSELDRWERRRDELRAHMGQLARGALPAPGDRTVAEVRAELEKVNRQVAYYQALTQDMKRSARPARVSDLLRALFLP